MLEDLISQIILQESQWIHTALLKLWPWKYIPSKKKRKKEKKIEKKTQTNNKNKKPTQQQQNKTTHHFP